jgi:ribosome-binding protein aMBF1 (putative translation factor)
MKKKITKKKAVEKPALKKKVAAKKVAKKKVATKKKRINKQDAIQDLADRIRSLRRKQGFTSYVHFASKHKIPRTLVGRFETGQDMRYISIVRVAHAFGMTLEEFFSEGFE